VSRKARTNIRPALQERSREKRDRLIKAGLSVFSRRGYAQTRMADVAAEAGVSVGVLYQRFKDKRGFFEVIVDTLAKDLHELIERVVATLVEVVERDVGFFLALITVGEEVPGVIGRIAATDRLRARRLHKLVTERGLVDGALIDEDKVFFALATAIRMLLVTATVDREPIRLRAPETLTELAAMLTGYLQAS
jgi:AcrR family transcriptional regulator